MKLRGIRLAALPIVAALVLAACAADPGPPGTSTDQPTGSTTPGSTATDSTESEAPATSGGDIVMARDSEPMTLNPMGASENGSIFMIVQIFDTLVETQDAPIPQPGLAESWQVSDDSKTWTFKLRPGVKFSNGDPLTCEDVKFSIDRFADEKVNTFYTGFGSAIGSTTCDGDSTFVIQLNRVEGAFLDYLATFIPSIIPKKVYEEMGDEAFGEAPIGSGPFVVKEWVRGEKLVLEKNPYYWKSGQPYLDSITVEYVPDDNTRMLKVESGEADIATEVPYAQLERIRELSGVTVQEDDVMAWDAVWFNQRKAPFKDPHVIKALNLATPKEAMITSLMHGAAEVANHVIAKVKYWDSTVPPIAYDVDAAKNEMAQSSVPGGFSMKCLIVAGDEAERQQMEVIQQEWAKIGVTVEIEAVDNSTIWDRWGSGDEDCFTYPGAGLSSDALSDDNLAVVFFDITGGADSFWTGYDSKKATELVAKAGTSIDEDERTAAFHELQRLVMDEYPAVPLFFIKARTALSDRIDGFKTLPVKWWNLEDVRVTG